MRINNLLAADKKPKSAGSKFKRAKSSVCRHQSVNMRKSKHPDSVTFTRQSVATGGQDQETNIDSSTHQVMKSEIGKIHEFAKRKSLPY